MNKFLKPLWLIYIIFIYYPIIIVATILTAIFTIIFCTIGNNNTIGFYPAVIWSKLACLLAFSPVEVVGRENLDKNQSYVFASNHTSTYDIFMIYGYLGRSFKWVMKQEIRKIPLVGFACKKVGHIFLNRKAIKDAFQSMEEVKKTLSNGVSVVIFPEGTRTKTGVTAPFKRGAFKVATETNLPIVPVTLVGAFKVWPTTRKYPIPGKLKMVIHKPVVLHEDAEHSNAQIEEIRQTVMSAL